LKILSFLEEKIMKIEIRLKNLLQKYKLDRHGVIKQIADETKVDRHKISAYYNNEVSKISLDVLAGICLWLKRKGVPATELPGSILGTRPSQLWQAVTTPGRVTIYLGEGQQTEPPAAAWRWISRRDATVAASFVRELSIPSEIGGSRPQVNLEYVPFRWDTKNAGTKKPFAKDIRNTKRIFHQMRANSCGTTSILIGSQRVNYLLEYLVADLFNCEPFCPQNRQARVPFYQVYRESDRKVPSCFGGMKNPWCRKSATVAGIHYLDDKGNWTSCQWKENKQDAGVIIELYDPGTKSLEIALFGFSGRTTEAVGNQFFQNKDRFWPPPVQFKGKQIGVYICRFDFAERTRTTKAEAVQVKKSDIISLDENIMRKFFR